MLERDDDDDIDIEVEHEPPQGIERRKSVRIGMRLGVRFNSPFELAEAIRATTANIGMGGLCLRTQKTYEPGTRLQLVIELTNDEPIACSAAVAWSRPGAAVGVRFEELTDAQRARLATLLGLPKPESDGEIEI
ncbi:MAG: PilZ domain-containing protein [Myxococcales bacterium]|jgi:uncharacterized protein (TIGR02266 family)